MADRINILKQAKAKIDALVAEKQREEVEEGLDTEAMKMVTFLECVDSIVSSIESSKLSREDMEEAFSNAVSRIQILAPEVTLPKIDIPKAEVEVRIPEIKVPEITIPPIVVPEPKVTVNVPEIQIPPFPEIKMPDSMEVHGDVGLFGYGFDNPLPVQLRDAKGNPVSLPDMMAIASGGGGSRVVKVTNDDSSPVPTSTIAEAITAATTDISASGDNTIVSISNTPRLYYISLSANGANSADVTAIVKIGTSSKYKVSLKAGAIWARHVGAGNRYLTGATGDDIVVNLSAAQTVHVSVEYEEV